MQYPNILTPKICFLLTFIVFTMNAFSQIEIKGNILTEEHQPIQFANVVLRKNNKIIEYAISDIEGKFKIESEKKDSLELEISYIGYRKYTRSISHSEELKDLVLETNNVLKEVTVNKHRKIVEKKVDRIILNVQGINTVIGASSIDVLKVAPRIRVDDQNITMIGKDHVLVMINDRKIKMSGQELVNYLQQLPSKEIKSIEVITTPPSKYKAQGNDGMINIVTHKVKKDYWNLTPSGFYEQAKKGSYGLSSSFNLRKRKTALTLYGSTNNYTREPNAYDKYYLPEGQSEERNKKRNRSNIGNIRASLTHALSDQWELGLDLTYGCNRYNNTSYLESIFSPKSNPVTTTNNKSTSERDQEYFTSTLYSKIKLDSLGKKLSIDLDYLKTENPSIYDFYNSDPSQVKSAQNMSVNLKNYQGKIDLELPIATGDLSIGTSYSHSETTNEYAFKIYPTTIMDPNKDLFLFDESTFATYISASFYISETIETQIGTRVERNYRHFSSNQIKEDKTYNQWQLFPTLYLTYLPNDNQEISLSYNKRIRRPLFTLLNPYKKQTNEYSYYQGNPNLKPQLVDNIEINHIYKNNLSSSIYYTHTHDGSSMYLMMNPDNYTKVWTPINYYTLHEVGISEGISYNYFKIFESYFMLDLYWSKLVSHRPQLISDIEGYGGAMNIDTTIKFNKKLSCNINVDYAFPSTYASTKNRSCLTIDMGIQAYLIKKKLLLRATYSDMFRTNKQKFDKYSNTVNSYHEYYADAQRLNLRLSYFIGSHKVRGVRKKTNSYKIKGRALATEE